METFSELVIRAPSGDVDAYAGLVQATQKMGWGVAVAVLASVA